MIYFGMAQMRYVEMKLSCGMVINKIKCTDRHEQGEVRATLASAILAFAKTQDLSSTSPLAMAEPLSSI